MDEYIEREALLKKMKNWHEKISLIECVNSMPAADVAPVRHGRWIERKSFHADGGVSAKCSVCKNDVQYLGNPLNYCPNCGSKMDGERKEGANND